MERASSSKREVVCVCVCVCVCVHVRVHFGGTKGTWRWSSLHSIVGQANSAHCHGDHRASTKLSLLASLHYTETLLDTLNKPSKCQATCQVSRRLRPLLFPLFIPKVCRLITETLWVSLTSPLEGPIYDTVEGLSGDGEVS